MMADCEVRSAAQVLSQLQSTRGFAAKEVRFGVDCRSGVLAGVDRLADAVQVTLGPKVGIHISSSMLLFLDYQSVLSCSKFTLQLHNIAVP